MPPTQARRSNATWLREARRAAASAATPSIVARGAPSSDVTISAGDPVSKRPNAGNAGDDHPRCAPSAHGSTTPSPSSAGKRSDAILDTGRSDEGPGDSALGPRPRAAFSTKRRGAASQVDRQGAPRSRPQARRRQRRDRRHRIAERRSAGKQPGSLQGDRDRARHRTGAGSAEASSGPSTVGKARRRTPVAPAIAIQQG